MPYICCIAYMEIERVLREVHEGITPFHKGAQPIVQKTLRLGYYCSTMKKKVIMVV